MILSDLLAAAATMPVPPTRLEPVKLFMDADIVVKAVMAALLLASIWSWMIIISVAMKIGGAKKRARKFERDFWASENYEETLDAYRNQDVAPARIAWGAITEWKKSTKGGVKDVRGAQGRIAAVMDSHVAEEADRMANRLTFLATLGSVAPFVGLFGTVWGIMNSFFQIGAQNNSSLAVVAPGISEALFATAIGLFAAIPAVIAYNRFSASVNSYEAILQRFADRFNANLGRELERV
ncbi:protein TolQ [Alteriqipengyuania sp. NZ-12B]|uniref:Protein TolQ n=1 Tax=Alteriqipengyuania abyssalis TaxID=2860200 RepID=A0ABS7PFW1_9SPHN|nr:protein TolQ [Alteriqipengyuania abyssalis]MBY8337952.1 protein TolQ [Alteriqipengyuania abyssalis]